MFNNYFITLILDLFLFILVMLNVITARRLYRSFSQNIKATNELIDKYEKHLIEHQKTEHQKIKIP